MILIISGTEFPRGQLFRVTRWQFDLEDALRILILIDIMLYSGGSWK